MSFFAHFNSTQVWMVLVQEENNSQHLETWLAPEGRDGVRRIFRNKHAKGRPIAAVPLPRLGLLGRTRGGLGVSLKNKMQGPEQAVFVMDDNEGTCRIELARGRTPSEAARKYDQDSDSAAVGGFYLDLVRNQAWSMRRMLDQQNPRMADMNLLEGDGLPKETDDGEQIFSKRPALWTKQDPNENDMEEPAA